MPGPKGPGGKEDKMCRLVWAEKLMGQTIIKVKLFPDRAERLKYILKLEKRKYFDKVLELS